MNLIIICIILGAITAIISIAALFIYIKKLETIVILTLCILIALFIILYSYYRYKNVVPNLAKQLLSETNPEKYSLLCNSLFENSNDPVMLSQYLDMKKSRPVAEVNNLCGNYAKIILGRK